MFGGVGINIEYEHENVIYMRRSSWLHGVISPPGSCLKVFGVWSASQTWFRFLIAGPASSEAETFFNHQAPGNCHEKQ